MNFKWNNVRPACCAKWLVLPTVYSDTLSYGEQLDKFCYQLNQLIENNNILPDFIAEMIKEYINSGAIGEVVRDILADYILNVKYPPEGITPAVGDGSADDTAAIQGCIDYAAENGGVVYFPYGSYLTQPLTMKDGVSLFGFDRYSTKIVLKGGATKPLIGGTIADLSIANLTLDGNSGIQVNDVNVVTLMATNVMFTNLIIKDGYTLVNYVGTGGHFQISDVVFGNAVEKCLLTTGNAEVQCENVVFNQLSAVGGVCVMDIGTDGGFFNVKSVATCNQCIVVSGNKNKISAIVENATTPFVDNGLQNNIEIFGVSNKEFYSSDTDKEVNGSYSKHIKMSYTKLIDGNSAEIVGGNFSNTVTGVSNETFVGDREVTQNNFTEATNGIKNVTAKTLRESVAETKTTNAKNLEIISENAVSVECDTLFANTDNLKYGVVEKNNGYNAVKFLDKNDNLYWLLTTDNQLKYEIKKDDLTNITQELSNGGIIIIPKDKTYYANGVELRDGTILCILGKLLLSNNSNTPLITLNDNCIICGSGIIDGNSENQTSVVENGLIYGNDVKNTKICCVRIGNNYVPGLYDNTKEIGCIHLVNCQNITLESLTFEKWQREGVYSDGGTHLICDNIFGDGDYNNNPCWSLLQVRTPYQIVKNCRGVRCGASTFHLDGIYSVAENCVSENNGYFVGLGFGHEGYPASYSVAKNCTVINSGDGNTESTFSFGVGGGSLKILFDGCTSINPSNMHFSCSDGADVVRFEACKFMGDVSQYLGTYYNCNLFFNDCLFESDKQMNNVKNKGKCVIRNCDFGDVFNGSVNVTNSGGDFDVTLTNKNIRGFETILIIAPSNKGGIDAGVVIKALNYGSAVLHVNNPASDANIRYFIP